MDNCSFESVDEQLLIFNNANTIANQAGTIGYEILVGMREYVERRIVD